MSFLIFILLYSIVLLNGFLPFFDTWFLGILLLIPVLYYWRQYAKSKRYMPMRKVCPNCGSTNVDFAFVTSGAVTTKSEAFDLTSVSSNKMAICKDCGTSFRFVASNEIQSIRGSRRNSMIFFLVAGLIIFAVIYFWRGAIMA